MTEEIQPGGLEIRGVEGSVQRHRREAHMGERQAERDGGPRDGRRVRSARTHTHNSTDLEGLAGGVDF